MKSFRDIRVIPVVLVAVFGLAVLKVAGLVLDGGYVFDYDPNSTQKSWAQETINFPGRPKVDPKGDLKGDFDISENLLKSAEKRIESRVEEMKATEARITTATGQKAEVEAARMKGIITMYEAMKPKDAAKVFDRLEMSVLFEIASQIAPRKMSDILGLMQPEAAERLTVEMARRAGGSDRTASSADLPKIEG